MNGGHYLTKGHVILCLLYIKAILMSRNILEPWKNLFQMQTAIQRLRFLKDVGCIREA